MTHRLGRLAAALLVGLLVVLSIGWFASPAQAADDWEIRSFDSVIVVDEDGSMHVTETIEVTFHVRSRGIFREIPFRTRVDRDTLRRYRFDQIEVRTSPGAPDDLHRETQGSYLVWRIGDPEVYLTGEHTYYLSYRVRGVLNRFDEHDELFWNVTGDRWPVPIQSASATVHSPGITEVRCFAGYTGGTDPCASADHDERTATFTADELAPGEQLDVVVAIPPGLVDVPPPELVPANLVQRFLKFFKADVRQVFQVDRTRVGAATGIGLSGLVAAVWLALRGPRMARQAQRQGLVGGALPGGVEYRPPDGLRPAQLRTLLTERVDLVSLSATLVDLAVRGHLRIEELPRRWGRQDWLLRQLEASTDGLQPYEKEVLSGLFTGRSTLAGTVGTVVQSRPGGAAVAAQPLASVTVSSLRDGSFHPSYVRAQQGVYNSLVHRGFFRGKDQVKLVFRRLSLLLMVAGVAGIIASFNREWTWGLVFAALPVVGYLLGSIGGRASRRTPAGEVIRQRAKGFREFVRTAEADRMDFAEREKTFVDYLPYAMAFGCVDRWVKAFERIGVPVATAAGTWYVGHGPLDAGRMTLSMSRLSVQVGTGMSKSPPSTSSGGGSSGFGGGGSSGGGAGGGGGGRW